MYSPPIPRKVLRQQAAYKPYLGAGKYNDIWGDEIPISYIAIDYGTKYSVTSDNQTAKFTATLFYDCRNSLPKGIIFKEKDKIIHNGKEMTVEAVNIPNSGTAEPHHYELGLI